MPKRPTECAYCGGPLPPPAVTGRPRSFCSAQCRQANERYVASQHREERERREREQSEAEATRRREKAEAERLRREEQEYQRAIKAGGRVAAEAKWWRASDETAIAGRYDLCQWEDEIDGEYTHVCFNRTRSDVYCSTHNRQLERELERNRRQRAEEARS